MRVVDLIRVLLCALSIDADIQYLGRPCMNHRRSLEAVVSVWVAQWPMEALCVFWSPSIVTGFPTAHCQLSAGRGQQQSASEAPAAHQSRIVPLPQPPCLEPASGASPSPFALILSLACAALPGRRPSISQALDIGLPPLGTGGTALGSSATVATPATPVGGVPTVRHWPRRARSRCATYKNCFVGRIF